ncbi:hypothetical protein O7627_24205 [Solwaraspora sp. WMMD1047]|uniref:hypothetical protein n=1 Tax=Solwaraspora sp. WMMD1047 TaxID=3016102 RepID=UPI002416EBC2|nr:hypothetical protein [Solwaraspora sp. WMMD1047]MDG4832386.1 hypothetical protein [Solwaraspora sp. WMMD1047]
MSQPTGLTADQLHTQLRRGASGVAELAAIDLLITAAPFVLTPTRPDVVRHAIADNTGLFLRLDWGGLMVEVDQGRIPLSRGERRVVDIALSLALPGVTVALGHALTGLDNIAAGAVLGAVRAVLTDGADRG